MKAKQLRETYYQKIRHKSWKDVDSLVDEVAKYLEELESRVITEIRDPAMLYIDRDQAVVQNLDALREMVLVRPGNAS